MHYRQWLVVLSFAGLACHTPDKGNPRVEITTTFGDIVVEKPGFRLSLSGPGDLRNPGDSGVPGRSGGA